MVVHQAGVDNERADILSRIKYNPTNLAVPMTENNGRFGKWSRALGQPANMIKWVMEGVQSAFYVDRHFALWVAYAVINAPKTGLRCGMRRAAVLHVRGYIGTPRSVYAPSG